MPKTIVIGAGIGGIATAIRLAIKGHRVEVYEANSYAGGKLWQFTSNGYRFDAGPSLFTMPKLVDELFELAGIDPKTEFRYDKLNVVCNYFYPDDTKLTAFADAAQLNREASNTFGENPEHLKKYFSNSKQIYDITNPVFLERSLHRFKTYLRWGTLLSVLRLSKIDAFRTMNDANMAFFDDARLVQFFNRYATYNGSDPYQAPGTLNVIPHLEHHFGAYFPEGGMYNIVKALVTLAQSLGVIFHYNSPVAEIVIDRGKVNGIMVNDQIKPADLIVSNIDVWFTYRKLLNKYPQWHLKKTLDQERSSSALIFYWGIRKQFAELDMHNIIFSANYSDEFESIWKHQTISDDPTVYVNISSKHKADDAPAGCENWFVMINVPANKGQNWDELIAAARTNITRKLSKTLGIDIRPLIECENILDPRSIESQTSSYQGALYGSSSNNKFAAFLRHPNKSPKIKGLYFCGSSVHPGGGIPLALLSAKIVSDWIG